MRISEIFYSIQGEGSRHGQPCAFVRLTGCPLRCVWCDSAFAFHGGEELAIESILARLAAYPTRMVCVTGGEPLAQPQVHALMRSLLELGYSVLLETSGALDAREVDPRVVRILDLKAPGSGESERNFWPNFTTLRPSDELKFVLADRNDYEWARLQIRALELISRSHTVLLSPVHGQLDPSQLAQWMLEDGLVATLQLQLHKLLWPGVERGV